MVVLLETPALVYLLTGPSSLYRSRMNLSESCRKQFRAAEAEKQQ
jgi:hypothetical protein